MPVSPMSENLYHHYVDGSLTPEAGHTAPRDQWLPSVPVTPFALPVHPGPLHAHPGPSRLHSGPTRFRFENQFQHSFSGAGSPSTSSRDALGDATGTTLNTQRTDATRKRAAASGMSGRARKRRRQGEPAICGVGPVPEVTDDAIDTGLEPPAFLASRRKYGSLVSDHAAKRNTVGATDVWWCVRGLETSEKPSTMPEVEAPFQKTRPKTAFVGCRFCIDEWHVWSNTNPQTATIRDHLISKHYDKFRVAVLTNKLKGWETFGRAPEARGKEREPFSLEGFYERFVRWIAVDDQSINVIDSPELRDLLLYVGTQLDEDDLPHRTKLTQLIYERFQVEFKKLIEELKNAAGRISFTSDLWTDQNPSGKRRGLSRRLSRLWKDTKSRKLGKTSHFSKTYCLVTFKCDR
ncbi:putative encoded by [Lyophyllum shimeji]|uniref:Encoded by n=1 Tax=Lyophyllum shimeji TaxID=47721 RepID=A0A9P3PMD3_LYOSH|nr:putative encoded by [Lyophyllum shimeji]